MASRCYRRVQGRPYPLMSLRRLEPCSTVPTNRSNFRYPNMITITGILRRLGPLGRRVAWNREFRNGAHFSGARSPVLLNIVKDRCHGKRIVELACGDGSLARAIQSFAWLSYDGFDISSVAIQQARASSVRGQKFHVLDMESWMPQENFDVLIIEEAINYLFPAAQIALLNRAFERAGPEGIAIITMHSRTKFKSIAERIYANYKVLIERSEGDRCYLILSSR
jgi:2-polyprenyl-3-methyl-5-hydroxy-6-metoxy-1,4-benzoquinol methylase